MVKRLFTTFVAILFFSQIHASNATDSAGAKAFIQDLGKRAIDSLTKPGVSQGQLESRFQNLLEEGFDVQAIGQFVMGRYWNRMSPDQQSRFIPIFEKRLTKSYANRFQEYRGVIFDVKDARSEGSHIIVTSTIQKPGGPKTPVDWRVKNGKIHDVKVEGVSMSITIRDEYSALIQSKNGNMDEFLNSLGSVTGSKRSRDRDDMDDDSPPAKRSKRLADQDDMDTDN
jgi:phospholipid transport system substrate-binding protein